MNAREKYVYVSDSLYINCKISSAYLFRALLLNGNPFPFLERKTRSKIINYSPISIRILRVLIFIYTFYKNKNKPAVNFVRNIKGDCLLVLRNGTNKIINFKNMEVTTKFPESVDLSFIEKEIDNIKRASSCVLAPDLISYDFDKKLFIEQFINFKRPSYSLSHINKVYKDIIPTLVGIMATEPITKVNIKKYLNENMISIKENINKFLESKVLSEEHTLEINSFYSLLERRIKNIAEHHNILLVLSHGDFWEGNMLKYENNIKVIDWNTINKRSCYFDFYFIMFSLASRNTDKYFGVNLLTKEIGRGVSILNTAMKNKKLFKKEREEILEYSELYRILFYVEFINLKLLELTFGNTHHIKEVIRWLTIFTIFEAEYYKKYN